MQYSNFQSFLNNLGNSIRTLSLQILSKYEFIYGYIFRNMAKKNWTFIRDIARNGVIEIRIEASV